MRNLPLWQSHSGEIAFLLAMPPAWPEGPFHGLRARGVEVDASWSRGRGGSDTLRPGVAGELKIRPLGGQRVARIQSAGRTIEATESGGIRLVRFERRQETEQVFVDGCAGCVKTRTRPSRRRTPSGRNSAMERIHV